MKRTVCFLMMSACASGQAPAPAQPVTPAAAPVATMTPAGPKPELGSFGFDESGMKPNVAPGDSFYTYANGKWEERTEIPADRSNYGMFTRLDDLSNERTREVITVAAQTQAAAGSEAQKVGDYYAAYMDEAAIEAKGLAPLKPTLDKIRKIKSKNDLAKWVAEQQMFSAHAPFGIAIGADDKDPNRNAVNLFQSGLGMPDRDYYLKDDAKLADIRKKYEAHVAAMFKLAAIDKPDARAKAIVDLEKKVAEIHWTRVDSRDADKTYNKWKREEFAKKAPGFEWATYFKAVGVASEADILVAQPSALIGTAKLLGSTPITVWQDWLLLQQLEGSSDVLPKPFDNEHFAFYGTVLGDIPEQKARWKRAVEQVNAAIGEAVGSLYVAKYFPPASKQAADQLVKNIIVAMGARLDSLTWMAPETKAKAKQKLAAFTPKIGYPEHWRDYTALEVKRDDAFGNDDRAAAFDFKRGLAKLGKPVDRSEWFMTPMTVNAYANPTFNEIVFPAAILQPPFFDASADPAVNYGGIGAVIGHEISHHFDDQGRKYDPTGKLSEWWTKDDATRFDALTAQLVKQYAEYEPLPGQKLNGELTLGENIADLAGLTVALDAYRRSLDGKPAPMIEGVSGEQRFFLGWAQVWRRKYREAELRNRLMTDPHSPSEFRTAVVRNLDGWYEAFKPQEKQALYLGQDKRVRIW